MAPKGSGFVKLWHTLRSRTDLSWPEKAVLAHLDDLARTRASRPNDTPIAIASACGMHRVATQKILRRLVARGYCAKHPSGGYWAHVQILDLQPQTTVAHGYSHEKPTATPVPEHEKPMATHPVAHGYSSVAHGYSAIRNNSRLLPEELPRQIPHTSKTVTPDEPTFGGVSSNGSGGDSACPPEPVAEAPPPYSPKHPEAARLNALLYSLIRERTPWQPDAKSEARGIRHMDLLLRLDLTKLSFKGQHPDAEDVETVIEWATAHSTPRFSWSDQIRSAANLRQHFPRMLIQIVREQEAPADEMPQERYKPRKGGW